MRRQQRAAKQRRMQHARRYGRTLRLPPASEAKTYRVHNAGGVDLVIVGTKGPRVLAPGASVDVVVGVGAPPRVRS